METNKFKRRIPRKQVQGKVELLIDDEVLNAEAVNISDSGICIESSKPLSFQIMLNQEGGIKRYQAHLVWSKTDQNGKISYGLCLEDDDEDLRGLGF